jgi:hypothetical protein
MGLDQFAYKVVASEKNYDFGYEPITQDGDEAYTVISQWRKHPNLQGWAEALWVRKLLNNPIHELAGRNFNCQPVRLTLEDIDDLERHVNNGRLPATVGFFFGESSDDYYKEQDLKFIENARQAIADGYEIYYDSWW